MIAPFRAICAPARMRIAGFAMLLSVAACGAPLPSPLQSPVTATATNTATPVPTATSGTVVVRNLAATATTGPTPNINATSTAVFLTATAAAASRTPVATQTPQATRKAATNSGGDVPASPAPIVGAGVTILSSSPRSLRGGPASIAIRAAEGAICRLEEIRTANGVETRVPVAGATVQTAGRDGGAAWIWVTDTAAALGPQLIEVNCGAAGSARFTLRIEP